MLRRSDVWWTRVVMTLAAPGTLMSLARPTIGIWQWRGRRSRSGARRSPSPYRSFILRWHHLFGLTFGVVVCTWIFSGVLSLNPGRWSSGIGATRAQLLSLARSLVTNATITDTATHTRYDSDYHAPTGHLTLPVIRVRYDDPDAAWLYLDPRLGTISQRMQRRSRLAVRRQRNRDRHAVAGFAVPRRVALTVTRAGEGVSRPHCSPSDSCGDSLASTVRISPA